MELRQLSALDLAAVGRLCEQELVLDRDAGELPSVLTRRPHLGLLAVDVPQLRSALLTAGFTAAESDGILGENFLRVFATPEGD
jgi:hypothetical protein